MKVLVVSGFLGAGKTTFLRELMRRTRGDFAVLENEYGTVGIDGPLLSAEPVSDAGALKLWELTEGCICCSMKADFASSVLTISNTVDPEFLLVEPTGVGMLRQVMENLSRIQYERIQLLRPVTLIDGNSFHRYRREFPEIYGDQLSAAGTILVSKMERASPEELDALAQELRTYNPEAEIQTTHYSLLSDDWMQGILSRTCHGSVPAATEAEGEKLEHLGLSHIELASEDQLLLILNGVVSGVFGKICRAKGYLQAGSGWLRFDLADGRYSITGVEPMPESRVVLIGTELKRSWLRAVFRKELQTAPVSQAVGRSRIRSDPRQRLGAKKIILPRENR